MIAEKHFSNGNNEESLVSINKSIDYNNKEPNYYRHKAKVYLAATTSQMGEQERNSLKNLALTDLETSFDLNQHNLATVRNNVPLYFFLANKNLNEPTSEENLDKDYLEYTRKYFAYTKRFTPNDVGTFVATAKYEKRLNLKEEYNYSLNKIRELRPDLLEWHPDLITQ